MKREIVAVIPAKKNSDRIIAKNTRPFYNTTLYELKLNQLKKVKGFRDIIVSSESKEILEIAEKNGFSTHLRDPSYSTSDVPMSEVYSCIASEVHGEFIAWINVTNPLAETVDYEEAINQFNKLDLNKYNCLLSAWELKENIFYNDKPVNFKPYPWPRSQDLVGCYALSFVINILKRNDMVKWESCVGSKPYFYLLDSLTSTDIDFQEDFDFCEMIYRQRYP